MSWLLECSPRLNRLLVSQRREFGAPSLESLASQRNSLPRTLNALLRCISNLCLMQSPTPCSYHAHYIHFPNDRSAVNGNLSTLNRDTFGFKASWLCKYHTANCLTGRSLGEQHLNGLRFHWLRVLRAVLPELYPVVSKVLEHSLWF